MFSQTLQNVRSIIKGKDEHTDLLTEKACASSLPNPQLYKTMGKLVPPACTDSRLLSEAQSSGYTGMSAF